MRGLLDALPAVPRIHSIALATLGSMEMVRSALNARHVMKMPKLNILALDGIMWIL